ncbi:MAG: hypothetical protein JRJ04_17400, partial [Deltaproteobacteria bacterium]|nr:hypothetical protein [Deltaproteobacteria bacterium]
RDLVPVANVSETYIMLYCNMDSPWRTLEEFIGYAQHTRTIIGCSGMGMLPHIAGIELAKKAEAAFSYVGYPSSHHAIEALMEKKTDVALVLSSAHDEKLRTLAIFEPERKPSLPRVPTAKEQGYDVIGYVRDSIAVKKGTPPEIIDALGDAFKKALVTPQIQSAFFSRKTEIKYLNSKDTMKLWISAVKAYRWVFDEIRQTQESART